MPLNRHNVDAFRAQDHKTRWMEALGALLSASMVRMGVVDGTGDEGPVGGGAWHGFREGTGVY